MKAGDHAVGIDVARVIEVKEVSDVAKMRTKWTIHKFKDPTGAIAELGRKGIPIEEILKRFGDAFQGMEEIIENLLLNEGINLLWTLGCGGTGTPWSSANARIGVGDSSAAEAATQTGLQGTNKAFKAMDSGYPTYGSAQRATWRSTFGGTEGNFAWNEITVVNAADDTGVNLNRKVQAMGTKASGTTWIATLEITLA